MSVYVYVPGAATHMKRVHSDGAAGRFFFFTFIDVHIIYIFFFFTFIDVHIFMRTSGAATHVKRISNIWYCDTHRKKLTLLEKKDVFSPFLFYFILFYFILFYLGVCT